MTKSVGKRGSGNEEFNHPKQIAISPNQLSCVRSIQQQNPNLVYKFSFQNSLRHQTMSEPVYVKFTNDEMFVISHEDNSCIHVYTLSGEKFRSLVTRGGIGIQDRDVYFFCLEAHNTVGQSSEQDGTGRVRIT